MSNGTYNQFSDLIAFYDRKRKECPKGVTLKLHDNRLLFLQFVDPTTGKRTSRSCSVQFTEKGVLEAIDKAYKVSEALKRYSTSSEFWEWYNAEIIGKNTIKNDLLTYREIFKKVEDNYFCGKNRNTGRQRERDVNKLGGVSDWSSFNAQYGSYFKLFPNWDNYPTWEEIKSVWDTKEPGSKTYLTFKTVALAIAELTPNNT
ncbi:MAG: recombinase, partial [Planktothrix sp.]